MCVFDFLPCISGYWYGPNRCHFSFQSKPLLASSWPSWTCLSWCKGLQGIETRLAKSLLSRRRSIAPNAGMHSLSHLVAHDVYCIKGRPNAMKYFLYYCRSLMKQPIVFMRVCNWTPKVRNLSMLSGWCHFLFKFTLPIFLFLTYCIVILCKTKNKMQNCAACIKKKSCV